MTALNPGRPLATVGGGSPGRRAEAVPGHLVASPCGVVADPGPGPDDAAAGGVGAVLAVAFDAVAALVLDGVALAVNTVAGVLWPVATAAEVMTRAVHDDPGDPWRPAGPRLPLDQGAQVAALRHLRSVPTDQPLDPGVPAAGEARTGYVTAAVPTETEVVWVIPGRPPVHVASRH